MNAKVVEWNKTKVDWGVEALCVINYITKIILNIDCRCTSYFFAFLVDFYESISARKCAWVIQMCEIFSLRHKMSAIYRSYTQQICLLLLGLHLFILWICSQVILKRSFESDSHKYQLYSVNIYFPPFSTVWQIQ